MVETTAPSTKITTIDGKSDQDEKRTSAKLESIVSSTRSTITTANPISHTEDISHREHGRALNLTNVASAAPTKAKAFNDLSDVSMDDDTFGDGNGAKEGMMIAQTKHKECESKVRKCIFRKFDAELAHSNSFTRTANEQNAKIHAVPCPTYLLLHNNK